MSTFYKWHKRISIFSIIFFLMFCITGLLLLFRNELNAWSLGQPSHGTSTMTMSPSSSSIFDAADAGAALVKQQYPSKDILNISPTMNRSNLLRYRIIDSSATSAPPARMGMGGDYTLYNPSSNTLVESHRVTPAHPWVRSALHTIHELHTRLALGKFGIYLVTILSMICFLSILSGVFLYGPFSSAYKRSTQTSNRLQISALHREFSMIASVWGIILSLTGVWVGGFFIANDYYTKNVASIATQELANHTSEILSPSEAIQRILSTYPNRQLISMDYPSKFNNYHYAFYLGSQNDDDPAMFLGQPVYANLYTDSTLDQYATKEIPWYFTGMKTMINLHIHNHNSMVLKILWAIWDTIIIIGMLLGIILTIMKRYHIPMKTTSIKSTLSPTHIWRIPAISSVLIACGLIIPMWPNSMTETIGAICLLIPLILFIYSLYQHYTRIRETL